MSKVDLTDPAIIGRLTAALEAAGVDGVEITRAGQSLRIQVASTAEKTVAQATTGKAATPSAATLVKAPMAGEFWTSDVSRAAPQVVTANGNLVGFLRVGPILLPVNAGASSRLRRHLVQPGTIVSFGDPIAEVEPEA
ncbi:acetyl-CoA carboxylase [Agrobacterium tumefaciens]|uniref:acetyl-CoA carboxylase n=1 Tax=Agrobacterium tumefaciens TaxID=358 RepID=UPI00287BD105|nr:acetyl-CoA carboxylase [Agrobacterium tumefaciens]MDS7594598.1 acetyl-CoA carboxylase [Agrobacterium tumefaciens]